MAKKTQQELEQPAKIYQVDAIENQVKAFAEEMRNNFVTVNQNIQTLITKSEGQVSPKAFQEGMAALKNSLESKIDEEVEKIHLTYKPIKDNNKWLQRAVGGQAIILVGQLIFIVYITRAAV